MEKWMGPKLASGFQSKWRVRMIGLAGELLFTEPDLGVR